MAEIICNGQNTRDINNHIKQLINKGETDIIVKGAWAKHNLGVAIMKPVSITFDSSVGYYCAGMIDGATVKIHGSAGWGLAESMMSGTVIVDGCVGNGAAAAMSGGTVVIHNDAAARLGVSMKRGLVIVAGNCGYMAGFMAQKGTIIVCGNTGEAFGDSMYETICHVGGEIDQLGIDAVIEEPTDEDISFLKSTISEHFPEKSQQITDKIQNFKKVVSGRKLWHFDKNERNVWREAL